MNARKALTDLIALNVPIARASLLVGQPRTREVVLAVGGRDGALRSLPRTVSVAREKVVQKRLNELSGAENTGNLE